MPRWTLSNEPPSAAQARHLVEEALPAHPSLDHIVLVTSELVANAVRHGHGDVEVSVEHAGPAVTLAVSVAADSDPAMGSPGPDAESGRGLAMVESLATRWGWERRGSIVRVWAEFTG